MLRKSGYRLFSLEMMEAKNEDLTLFEDKNDMKKFVENIHKFMESEEYKMKRDCDINKVEEMLGSSLERNYYEYRFEDKRRNNNKEESKEDEKKNEDKEKRKERSKNAKPKKTVSPEEVSRLKNEEEKKMLTLINIGKLSQNPPSRFIKQAFQNDFEAGLDAMFKHLNKKVAHQFPFEVEAHKIFVNLNLIPYGRQTPQTEFYLGQLADYILQLKIKLYEMKLNGLSRIFIPISLNTDLIAIIKKVYDMHNIIDRIMGDKLLHQQYMFLYEKIQFVSNSSVKEELETFHSKPFIEDLLPMYLFYESMCHSAKVLSKMISHSRSEGGHFSIEDYYQPTKHAINTENNLVINCFELKDSLKKALTEELNEKIEIMWKEIDLYGRFWLMEGMFPPEDKDKWLK